MISVRKVFGLGLVVALGLFAAACQVPADGDEATGEAAQELVFCESDCSGVRGASPIWVTCLDTCSATTTEVSCEGVVTACAPDGTPAAARQKAAESKMPDEPWFLHPRGVKSPPKLH